MNISQVLTKLKALIYSKSETDSLLGGKANSSHTHTKSQITDFPAYGSTAGTICQGNDARLSDARTPTSHTHTKSQITDFPTIPTNTNQLTNGSGYLSGTVGIANGGTGATTRLEAAKNLTNENVGTNTQYFFTLTQNWGKVGYASVADAKSVLGVPSKTSQLTNDSGFLTTHNPVDGSLSSTSTNAVQNKVVSTELSGKVNRVDHGYKTIGGNGTYSWCKLATITIKSGYINNPISFEVDGRGRERSILQVLFANVSNNDPSLTSFKSDLDTNFYIKKVATSTWELYGNYSEAWGSFTLYRVTSSINSNSVAIDTTLSNLSSAPSGTTRVSLNISVPTKTSQLTNDSGFLTSHQSLSNYLAKYTGVSEMGRYIDLHYDGATAARDYDVRLYADSQGSSNGGGSFKISSASVYTPNNLYLGSYRVYVG